MSINSVLPPSKPIAYQELGELGKAIWTLRVMAGVTVAALLVAGYMARQMVRMGQSLASVKPDIIHITDMGEAQAVNLAQSTFVPGDPELKYFIKRFDHLFYGRDKRTLGKEYPLSGYYLAPKKWQEVQAFDQQTKWVQKFLTSTDDSVEIDIHNNIALDKSAYPKYRALVTFDKRYISSAGTQARKETCQETMYFTQDAGLIRKVPGIENENPLGFQIEYERADCGVSEKEENGQ